MSANSKRSSRKHSYDERDAAEIVKTKVEHIIIHSGNEENEEEESNTCIVCLTEIRRKEFEAEVGHTLTDAEFDALCVSKFDEVHSGHGATEILKKGRELAVSHH